MESKISFWKIWHKIEDVFQRFLLGGNFSQKPPANFLLLLTGLMYILKPIPVLNVLLDPEQVKRCGITVID